MRGKLVSAVEWGDDRGIWSCSLLYLDEEFKRIPLEPGSHLSFKVLEGRFCIGFTRLSGEANEEGSSDAWRELSPCPYGAEVERGTRCRRCAMSDVTRACLRCTGVDCLAHPALRRVCEGSVAYVYLASFGAGRIKAGVSRGSRIMKRWIEQGADVARRVLVGNGREVRRYERQIQDELGALRRVKAEQKMDIRRSDANLERSLRLLNAFEERVRGRFPEAHHFHEESRILLPQYRLPELDKRPLELRIRKGLEVSGEVLGVKGPILLIEMRDLPFTLNLNGLIGRRIETEEVSLTSAQTGLDRFLYEPW